MLAGATIAANWYAYPSWGLRGGRSAIAGIEVSQ